MSNEINTKEIAKLTEREQKFIEIYFENGFNATRAILSLGGKVSERSARTLGARMLSAQRVKDEVDRRLIEWRAARRMTVQQFGDLLADAAAVDISDFYDESGVMKPLSEIPPHARKQICAIEPVECTETVRVRDPETNRMKSEIRYTIRYKIKLWDRRKAEEMWGKWQKMFTDKIEATGADGGPLKVSVVINAKRKDKGE